ncbi:MAG TPA: ABC transporter permease, partial [Usitatibacteraceae bacterium]|nr:ABC transporter permease [Usitatibacteraceae bacterium]
MSVHSHLPLFRQLTERELQSRFAGSALGLVWALIGPLLLLAIYSFVFGQLFAPRAPDLGTESYTMFVAVALWPWMMFADGVLRGLTAIQANGSLVKKVAFPHWLLVAASVSATFALHLLGFCAVLVVLALAGMPVRFSGIPLAALYLVLLFGITLGLAAILAALQTLLRDVEMAVTPAVMMLHFLTPVLYPLALIPEAWRGAFALNPLAGVIGGIRGALLGGAVEHAGALAVGVLTAGIALALGS